MPPILRKRSGSFVKYPHPESSLNSAKTIYASNSKLPKLATPKRKATTSICKLKFDNRKSNKNKSSSSSRTTINHLPFDCFFTIFSHFPLRNLIPLRRISQTWNSNISQVCARKERLTLFPYSGRGSHKENAQDLYWIDNLKGYIGDRFVNRHDCLEFPTEHLTQNHCSFHGLGGLFESVTQLTIHYDVDLFWPDHAQLLTQLIESFTSNQLKSFQFWIPTNPRLIGEYSAFLPAIYKVFNENLNSTRLPALKQLDLCIGYNGITQANRDFCRLQLGTDILGPLERFSLDCFVDALSFVSLLGKLGPKLSYLSLECKNFQIQPHPVDLLDSIAFNQLTHLRLDNLPNSPAMFQKFCERFRVSLQFVQLKRSAVYYGSNDIVFGHKWFKPLVLLERLSELRLHSFKLESNQVDDSTLPLPSLPRVKKLTLCISILLYPYFDRESSKIDTVKLAQTIGKQFPNLEELTLACNTKWFLGKSIRKTDQLEQQICEHLYQHLAKLRLCKLDLNANKFCNIVTN